MNPIFQCQREHGNQQQRAGLSGVLKGVTVPWLSDMYKQQEYKGYLCCGIADTVAYSHSNNPNEILEVGEYVPETFRDAYDIDYYGGYCSSTIIFNILKFSLTPEEMLVVKRAMEEVFLVTFDDGTPNIGEYSYSLETILECAFQVDKSFTKALDRIQVEWKYWDEKEVSIRIVRPSAFDLRMQLLQNMDPNFVFPDIPFRLSYHKV